jgi:RNA polymerase sigma-70 factor (ECF subfamily)
MNMNKKGNTGDSEIIEKVLAGDTGLFELLIRRYDGYLYKIGRSYRYNHEDTQDLMQDAFVDAYRYLSGFGNRSSFKTWLVRIMLNKCYKKQQKSSFKYEGSAEPSENAVPMFSEKSDMDTYQHVIGGELKQVLEEAVQKLPMPYRMVFVLRQVNGLSIKESAEALDISDTNVKVRLNRARVMLRKEVEKTYSTDEIFEFNLKYCDAMVNRVMSKIEELEP